LMGPGKPAHSVCSAWQAAILGPCASVAQSSHAR
jgi:hypothetical protein